MDWAVNISPLIKPFHWEEIVSILQIIFAAVLLSERNKASGVPQKSTYSDYSIILLAAVCAATFQVGNNTEYLTLATLPIYYLSLIAVAWALFSLLKFLFRGSLNSKELSVSVSAFIFCLILTPSVQAMLKRYGTTSFTFIPFFLLIYVLSAFYARKFGKMIIAFMLLSTVVSGVNLWNLGEPIIQDTAIVRENENHGIEFADKRNVYLLVYDSTPDIKTLEQLGVEPTELSDVLKSHNFKIYSGTYTMAGDSLSSMSATYAISDKLLTSIQRWQRNACAGNAISFKIFQDNSYVTSSIQSTYMTGGEFYVDKHFPPVENSDIEFLVILLRGILAGEFRFDIVGRSSVNEDSYHKFLREEAVSEKNPHFTVMHVGKPGHSQNSGNLLPNETELYTERLKNAVSYLRDDLEAIIKNDPSSIVLVIGDHGPYLTGDGTSLIGYHPKDISELMIRDRFSTMIAIRWSNPERASKYDQDLLINQDIFPVVFAYLADSTEPLKLMLKEKKAVLKGHAFLDNGVFVPYVKE